MTVLSFAHRPLEKLCGFDRKARDAAGRPARYKAPMTQPIDSDAAWAAFVARERDADGRFVVAVRSTGIYCRPSCPARRPRRDGVRFFADGPAAQAAGYRACRRCLPDSVARDRAAVAEAAAMLEAAGGTLALDALAAGVGYAPHHFQRLFKRATGVTPAAYGRAVRANRAAEALREEASVTEAIYAAGYAAPSRFYADAAPRLGMAPATWARGGAGTAIRWVIADTSLGPLLVAATERGLCRIAFDEDGAALARRFPRAELAPGGPDLADLAARVVALVERPGTDTDLPRDVRGTAFQEAIWAALRTIPAGETLSYRDLAARAGRPGATRAAGSACGANPLAVLVPCHRVTRSDGTAGDYAYGTDRKQALLAREAEG